MQVITILAFVCGVGLSVAAFVWASPTTWTMRQRFLTGLKYSIPGVVVLLGLFVEHEEPLMIFLLQVLPVSICATICAFQHFHCRYSAWGGLSRLSAWKVSLASIPSWALLLGSVVGVFELIQKPGYKDYYLTTLGFLFGTILTVLPLGTFYFQRRDEYPNRVMSPAETLYMAMLKMTGLFLLVGGIFFFGLHLIKDAGKGLSERPKLSSNSPVVSEVATTYYNLVVIGTFLLGIGVCAFALKIGFSAFVKPGTPDKKSVGRD